MASCCCTSGESSSAPPSKILEKEKVIGLLVGDDAPAVVDTRSAAAFSSSRVRGSLHLPPNDLVGRGLELPRPGARLLLVAAGDESVVTAVEADVSRRYTVVGKAMFDEELEKALDCSALLAQGPPDREELNTTLWTPSPCLEEVIETVEKHLVKSNDSFESVRDLAAVDLACGSGRDGVWLAIRGWTVLCVDYKQQQLDSVAALAARHGVSDRVFTALIDLEANDLYASDAEKKPDQLVLEHSPLPAQRAFHLVTVARYLHRPLFPFIPTLLDPAAAGAAVVYHTFMAGCEATAVGRPRRPKFLLQPDELREVFTSPPGDMKVLMDKVETISDGRPTAFFAATKE